jgi:glycosyltransferase involved in cell wall biosynthesis
MKAVQSVRDQNFDAFEIIVSDDGSTDDTRSRVEALGDKRVKYVFQNNTGVSAARNLGAAHASGQYLIFLDSDDLLSPHYLKRFYEEISKHACKLVFGYADYINTAGVAFVHVSPRKENGGGPPLAGAYAIARTFYEETKGYDPQLHYSENTEFFLRIRLHHPVKVEEIGIVEDEGVIVHFRDKRERFNMYSEKKYKSTGYLLEKHRDYFRTAVGDFVNYKTIYAVGAFMQGDVGEARKSIGEVIARKPLRFKAYLQALLFWLPALGRLYWKNARQAN